MTSSNWRRYAPILLAGLGGCALSWWLYYGAKHSEEVRLEREFTQVASNLGAAWQRAWTGHLESLEGIRNFYEGSISVEADEFARFTKSTFASHVGLQMMGWVPHVPAPAFYDHVALADTKYHLPSGYVVRNAEGEPLV